MTQPNLQRSRPIVDTPLFLLHQWVAAGIVSAACRFLPIPFVDDMIRGQCRRFVVARTLASHSVPVSPETLKPYYVVGNGYFSGVAGKVMKAPLKLLFFPVRKTVAVVTSIRGVPLEIIRTVLLGRTLDRWIREGRIGSGSNVTETAQRMRAAFDEAFARMDFHVVRAATSDALSSVSGWKEAAIASANKLANRSEAAGEYLQPEPKVEASATRVEEVLARPETLRLFAEFDRRFDAAYQQLAKTSSRRV